MKKVILIIIFIAILFGIISRTWVINSGDPFKLRVIGDVGAKGPIRDVRLTAAFPTLETGTITLSPTTTSGLTDPSTPGTPTTDDTIPLKTDESVLPSHGIYGPGTSWNGYELGDFTLIDYPIGDLIDTFPLSFLSNGQMNVYNVIVTGYSMVQFDAFDTIDGETHAKFAPFSNDAVTQVPEPSTLMLIGPGLIGIGIYRWRSMRKQK